MPKGDGFPWCRPVAGAGSAVWAPAAVAGEEAAGTKRGPKTVRSPVDRGRTGSKHHLITDATGIPIAVTPTGGNRNDVTQLIPLLQAVPPVRGKRGRPRRRPDVVLGDRGYDRQVPPPRPRAGREATDRATRHRTRLRTRHPTPGCRARLLPPALVPPPADPLGDPRRHPRSLPHPGMRTHLPATLEVTASSSLAAGSSLPRSATPAGPGRAAHAACRPSRSPDPGPHGPKRRTRRCRPR